MGYAKIYGIVSKATGKVVYIGKANDPEKRFKGHLRDSTRRQTPLYDWMRSHNGADATYVVLASAISDDWQSLEILMIAQYRNESKLLNLADGGNQPTQTKEQKSKNSIKLNHCSNPEEQRVWSIKRRINTIITGWKKDKRYDSFDPHVEKVKAKLRYCAWKRPDLFGSYASL